MLDAPPPLASLRRRTFQRIAAKRSTEDFSGTPYVVATSQCATWLLYCALTPGRTAPGVTNGLGMLIEARASRGSLCYRRCSGRCVRAAGAAWTDAAWTTLR